MSLAAILILSSQLFLGLPIYLFTHAYPLHLLSSQRYPNKTTDLRFAIRELPANSTPGKYKYLPYTSFRNTLIYVTSSK